MLNDALTHSAVLIQVRNNLYKYETSDISAEPESCGGCGRRGVRIKASLHNIQMSNGGWKMANLMQFLI